MTGPLVAASREHRAEIPAQLAWPQCEGAEAGMARAEDAPEESEQHQRGEQQAGEHVQGKGRRMLGDVGDHEGRDERGAEQPVKDARRQVVDARRG